MSEKHTPGPWRHYAGTHSMYSESGRAICVTTGARKTADPERDQNGQLIAAAPDLLEALKGVLRVADLATDEFDAARAAIAKAIGTTT